MYLAIFFLYVKARLKQVTFVLGLKTFLCDITREEKNARAKISQSGSGLKLT